MADSDEEFRLSEVERDNLQRAISEVEQAIATSKDRKPTLETFLQGARARVGTLDRKIKDGRAERDAQVRDQIALVAQAEKETALSAQEKETFSGFLKEEFFTKKDFDRLEKFYEHTYDRLSEDGKDAMSHRIWEGVRRDQYTFSELPKNVQKKESERAYAVLEQRKVDGGKAAAIPERDREDFMRAFKDGKQEEASKILQRESFKNGMFLEDKSAPRSQKTAEHGAEVGNETIAAKVVERSSNSGDRKAPTATNEATRDLSSFALDGVKLVDTDKQANSSELPNAKHPGSPQKQSLRGA